MIFDVDLFLVLQIACETVLFRSSGAKKRPSWKVLTLEHLWRKMWCSLTLEGTYLGTPVDHHGFFPCDAFRSSHLFDPIYLGTRLINPVNSVDPGHGAFHSMVHRGLPNPRHGAFLGLWGTRNFRGYLGDSTGLDVFYHLPGEGCWILR